MKRLFLLLPFLLISGALFAQDPVLAGGDGRWSLQESVAYAQANSIQVQQNRLLLEGDQAGLFQARALQLPTVNGNAQYAFNTGRTLDPTTQEFRENATIQTSSLSLNAGLNLFSGLQVRTTIQQRRTGLAARQMDLEQSRNDVSLNTVLAYMQVLFTQELLEVASQQVEASRLQVDRTERLVKAGSLPQNNLLDQQAQLAADELSLTNAQNNLDIAKLNLQQTMNLPARTDFEIERMEVGEPNLEPYPQTPQAIYDLAQRSQPGILGADLRIESSKLGVAAARSAYYPQLSVFGSVSSNYSSARKRFLISGSPVFPSGDTIGYVGGDANQPVFSNFSTPNFQVSQENIPYFQQIEDNVTQAFGFRLSIPILNAWQTRTNVTQAIIARKTAEFTAQSNRVQLRQTIEQAYNNRRAAAARYQSARNQVQALEQAYRVNDVRYNAGAINAVDFNLAKVNLDRARAELVQAKYDYLLRTKILDFYQNKPLSF